MRFVLFASVMVCGVAFCAQGESSRGAFPTLAQCRANPRSGVVMTQVLDEARKEAADKFNCVIQPSFVFAAGGVWEKGGGKNFLCEPVSGYWLKFDAEGKLVKAGCGNAIEEVAWMNKRSCEIRQARQCKTTKAVECLETRQESRADAIGNVSK